ncbi:MAG: calcium-binding protein [Alphaproteobacteria bacterium]
MALTIDLSAGLAGVGQRLAGAATLDGTGNAVAGGADVNDDGIVDLIIGAQFADTGNPDNGVAYVVFGGTTTFDAALDLGALGDAGIVLNGPGANEIAGQEVDIGPDVNGDGIADILIGAPYAGGGGTLRGNTYVIFGGTGLVDDIGLNTLDGIGLAISGEIDSDQNGTGLAFVGDVNSDGVGDFVTAAPGNPTAASNAGATYLILGNANLGPDINLSAYAGDVVFRGEAEDDRLGRRVAGQGDVNGDGFDDILLVATNGGGGFKVSGHGGTEPLEEVAVVGDVNDDGFDDVAVSSRFGSDMVTYLLFGGAGLGADFDLANLGNAGIRLTGGGGTSAGDSVAGAGDFNGDGVEDLLIGAPYKSDEGDNRGAVYVVFGRSGGFSGDIDLDTLADDEGVIVSGEAGNDFLGQSVAGVGDVNNDGFDDILIGATGSDAGGVDSGAAYVVFGFGTLTGGDGVDSLTGGAGGDSLDGGGGADLLIAGAGNDTAQGGAGNDRAYGQSGADSLLGGTGDDSLFGNPDDDTLVGGDGDDSMKAHPGADMVMGEGGNDVAFGGANDDIIDGGADSDTLNGNSGFDTITGGAGHEPLRGQGGRDSLEGGDGDDLLLGMQGFDTLVGGAGNDGLIGGPADDTLTGGTGVDSFTFAAGHGGNTITDFEDGTDIISITAASAFGDLVIADTGAGARITLATGGDGLSVTLTGITADQLSAADFVFS